MKRNLFPSLLVGLSLVGLFTTATATDYGESPLGVEIDVDAYRGGALDMDEYARDMRMSSSTGMPAGWHGATGASPADNPAQARELGADWLVKHQRADGGWGAGSWGADDLSAPSDVATTCYVVLALFRDANGTDKNREAIEKGVLFVTNAVETAPEGPRLNTPQGTQPQYKLGELVDTHFAALLFGEVDGQLSEKVNREVGIWWDVVLSKVQMTQQANGAFDANGWAPVLSSSIAAQSLYTAKMKGKDVADEVLERSDDYQASLAGDGESFDSSAGAGVELYAVASSLRGNDQAAKRQKAAGDAAAAESTAAAGASIDRVAADADGRLVAGFGSIGGEEMLSYQMISDTLAENGGEQWTTWNGRIGQHLVGIQNADGSWSGHHCITSTVFVTAGGVLTLAAGDNATRKAAQASGRSAKL